MWDQDVQNRKSLKLCQISGDIRDKIAVERMAAGYLKLLYPHLQLTDNELFEYCIEPARRFSQLVRVQLSMMDREFERINSCSQGLTILSRYVMSNDENR